MHTIKIARTKLYEQWFDALDNSVKARVQKGIDRMAVGNFGDHKALGDKVYEMRFHFDAGYRVYYTYDGHELVLLLAGGNKRSQRDDIDCAKYMANHKEEL